MGRNIEVILQQELENLDKDSDSRKLAMKALKSYVKDMDTKAIPIFLAQVSDTKESGLHSGEYTISLYEVLARVHGPNIVPQINNIMSTIIKTLSSSVGSFALHQACSKVVPSIARYAIDPTTPNDKKRYIVQSLCKPLSESLLGSQESLSSGSALCLKALVESDNWRFASNEMVNEVCLKIAGALEEKALQTNSHMGLVMALAKHNPLTVEAYARLLLHSGLRILNAGVVEGNSQKRLSAIQMLNFLMKSLDPRSVFSELELISEEMEKCQFDQMAFVKGAAFEALQTAKRIISEKGSKIEQECSGSNFSRRRRRNISSNGGDQSPLSGSPESQTLNSFSEYDSFVESPISTRQVSPNWNSDRRSVNRKLWRHENGGVDISLKDGLFTENGGSSILSKGGSHKERFGQYGPNRDDEEEHHIQGFTGFMQRSPRNGHMRSTTPSPQRSRSRVNIENIKIFTTPRKLIHSLQDQNEMNSDFSEKRSRRYKSPSSKFVWASTTKYNHNGFLSHDNMNYENENLSGYDDHVGSESVSSTEDVPAVEDGDMEVFDNVINGSIDTSKISSRKLYRKTAFKLMCSFFMLVALLTCLVWIGDRDEGYNNTIVPT